MVFRATKSLSTLMASHFNLCVQAVLKVDRMLKQMTHHHLHSLQNLTPLLHVGDFPNNLRDYSLGMFRQLAFAYIFQFQHNWCRIIVFRRDGLLCALLRAFLGCFIVVFGLFCCFIVEFGLFCCLTHCKPGVQSTEGTNLCPL